MPKPESTENTVQASTLQASTESHEMQRMIAEPKVDAEANERFVRVTQLVKQSLNSEIYATMQILKLFRDRQTHSWRDVEKAADVSKFTVNKKLKDLTKAEVLA